MKKPLSISGEPRVMKPNSSLARNDFIELATAGRQFATTSAGCQSLLDFKGVKPQCRRPRGRSRPNGVVLRPSLAGLRVM
jgi:hypothetical protein